MKKITIAILAFAITAAGAVFVLGQTGGDDTPRKAPHSRHGKFGKRGMGGDRMFRHLDLTDEQKAQVKAIREASRENTKALHDSMREVRKQIAVLGTEGPLDMAQLELLAGQQAEYQKQMIIERQKTKAQVFALLTPEQKAKHAEMKATFGDRMNKRKEMFKRKLTEKKADQ